MTFPDAVRTCLRHYATFAGRARRSEFWYFWLFSVLVQLAAGMVDVALFGDVGLLNPIVSLLLVVPGIAVGARRLHDTGRSGWWLLIGLVPLVGVIVLIIWYAAVGEAGPNRFGPDPRGGDRLGGGPAEGAWPRGSSGGTST